MNYLKKTFIYLIIVFFMIAFISFFLSINNKSDVLVFSETIDEKYNSSTYLIYDDFDNRFSNIEVGDIISFGRFYDINDNESIERIPIKWKVLDKVDGYSLLISKDIIKSMPYNTFWVPTSWKESNIRFWLNYDFYDLAFNEEEKQLIKQVELENIGNYAYNVTCDYKTLDKVFLLSIEEIKKYNTYHKDYCVEGTKYAKQYGLWISKYDTSIGYSVWWLRSPGKTTSSAAIMHADGTIGLGGDGVATHGNGVRPCIWIKTD